jgi:OmpA-OmpF porin, OOP family
MNRIAKKISLFVFSTALLGAICGFAQGEASEEAKWYVSAGPAWLQFEGDEEAESGAALSAHLGYEYNEWWSMEGSFFIAPSLDINTVGNTFIDPATGATVSRRVKLADADSTDAFGFAVDGLFHFTRWERIDPYLSVGVGTTFYTEDVNDSSFDPSVRVGGGVFYHFNDEWALRADARTFIAGNDTEANMLLEIGASWTWGARVGTSYVAVDGPKDSDGDGLPDADEGTWGTDPFDPDSDKDGLNDGEEVFTYKTNPLDPDTDLDHLKDGYDEVHQYHTNPLKRDTDDGGVDDGHEVIEDGTDPLDGADDLMLISLEINFDSDKSIIKPEFFDDLDVVAKVLQRNPGASARIEGHADRRKKSKAEYNKKLSDRRAKAALDNLVSHGGIERSRLESVGYGFERPVAPNDPTRGNLENRRVDVYIRGAKITD